MPSPSWGAATMINLTCPLCREVYHADPVHVGKHIKCSRCGSMVPIVERATTVSQCPADVVRPAVSVRPEHRQTSRRHPWAVGAVLTLVLVAFALAWLHFGNKATVNDPGLRDTGKNIRSSPDAAVSDPPKTSGDYEIADLVPDPSDPALATGSDVARHREPEQRPRVYRSLSTGTRFCKGTLPTGEGVLRVENGTAEDAALRLYDASSGQTIRCLFVKANESLRIAGIPEGVYGVKYSSGLDWQANSETFRWLPSYSRFDRQFPKSPLGRALFKRHDGHRRSASGIRPFSQYSARLVGHRVR
jgi:hypothetical protein